MANTSSPAVSFFSSHLAFHTDVTDVHNSLESGGADFTLIDSRGRAAWDQGHIPGAVHLPTVEIASRAAGMFSPGVSIVTYCWGPGCNGATRAALEFARLGFDVKEMLGGFEYWVREGFKAESFGGPLSRRPDSLTTTGPSCQC